MNILIHHVTQSDRNPISNRKIEMKQFDALVGRENFFFVLKDITGFVKITSG
jgi:hypothetical protein